MNDLPLKGKHIVLGICGGIAAYKSAALLRLLVKGGAEVQVVITPAGKEFITPVTLSALSGKPVVSEFFTANSGEWHSHVDLGLWADLMVIAPATASTIGKMANGIADNMLVTTYLSAKEHVMIAPSMDLDMWAHPSTQRNIETLKNDGVGIIEPGSGELASHLVGKGRMAEPEEIYGRVVEYLAPQRDMKGMKVLITAGPTYEKIDPVRFIGNYSSGKMGYSIAEECSRRGADVRIVSGPVSLPAPLGVTVERVESALEMADAVMAGIGDTDVAVFAAAVADYRPASTADKKIKREKTEGMTLELVKNPDISAMAAARKRPGSVMAGFALETDDALANAESKMKRKGLDMVVLNSLADPGAGFGVDTNKVTILTAGGEPVTYPLKSKREVAADIVNEIMRLRGRLEE